MKSCKDCQKAIRTLAIIRTWADFCVEIPNNPEYKDMILTWIKNRAAETLEEIENGRK